LQKTSDLNVATRDPIARPESGRGVVQATVSSLFNALTDAKEAADRAVAKMFYATVMPFNIADSTYFKETVKEIVACGPTYRPPERKSLGTTMLAKELANVKHKTETTMNNCTRDGVTLVSDGWTSVQSKPIINILMVSSEGATFLSATDTSGKKMQNI